MSRSLILVALALLVVSAMAAHAEEAIELGVPVNGTLADSDLQLPEGEFVDEYTINLEAGTRISIRMNSEDFDTYLIFLDADAETPQVDNDDFGGARNSGIDIEVTTTGLVVIGATSYGSGETGAYTLTVTAAAEE